MNTQANTINWFEVPAVDFERAIKFYSAVFGIEMETMDMDGMPMAFFPYEPGSGKLSGALVKSEMHVPSDSSGVVVYFNGDPDLSDALSRVEGAGGKIIMPKTEISPEHGYFAYFQDTEGNRVAMHSQA